MLRSTFAEQAPEHSYFSLRSRFWATTGSAAFVADFHRVDNNNSNTNNTGDLILFKNVLEYQNCSNLPFGTFKSYVC